MSLMIKLAKLCLEKGDNQVLRVGVRSGGCSGMSYTMDFVPASDTLDDDETYDANDVNGDGEVRMCVGEAGSYLE